MALIVQTSVGLSTADTYVTLASFETWCENRNRDLSGYSDEQKEAALRAATLYVDTVQRYKGITYASDQSTEFPRSGLVDWNGREVAGLPARVTNATCELAWAQLLSGDDLYENLDRGGKVASESVGPIATSYFADAPVGVVYRAAMQLLAPFARDARQAYPPYIGGAAGQTSTADAETSLTPIFEFGMHENTGE